MSRLIDADKIIKQLDPNTWQGEMLIAIVNGSPTAFDVDKVVGEIEKEVLGKATHHEYDNGIYKAISIVKGAVKYE